jgi:preprotein translocase subunit YajC
MFLFSADAAAPTSGSLLPMLAVYAVFIVVLYFIMIRPQQKQEKQTREMQKNLQVGDEVVTIGGIVGIVLRVEDATETVVLETGSDRLKIRLKQDAIKENVTAMEQAAAEKAAKDKEKKNKAGIATGKSKDE